MEKAAQQKPFTAQPHAFAVLGIKLPGDWNGNIQVLGSIVKNVEDRESVIPVADAGVEPALWGVYVQCHDDTRVLIDSFGSRKPADELADGLADIYESDRQKPYELNDQIQFFVCNSNTLCYQERGVTMLGVLANNIHGRDLKNGPFLAGTNDELRPATIEDFARFHVRLPSDSSLDNNQELTGNTPAHVENKVKPMEKEAQAAIQYIGERLPKPDWETARNLISSADRKGFVYLAKPNAQYAGKVLMMSDTHMVQQIGKNSAVAHDLSKLENGPELGQQFDSGEIKAGQTNVKVAYNQDRGKADVITYNQQRAEIVRTQAEKWAEQHITNTKSRQTFLKHVQAFAQDMAKGHEPVKTQPAQAKTPEKTLAPQQQQRGR